MRTALCATVLGVAMLTGYGLSAPSAQAGYVVTLEEVGSNVVATAIDLTGLSSSARLYGVLASGQHHPGNNHPDLDYAAFGTFYDGISGFSPFGSGGATVASSGSGDRVGVDLGSALFVPFGYVSGKSTVGGALDLGHDGSRLCRNWRPRLSRPPQGDRRGVTETCPVERPVRLSLGGGVNVPSPFSRSI